jgi:transposase
LTALKKWRSSDVIKKTPGDCGADQLDLQALHRVRERLVSHRTGIINQIRAFLLERDIAVRQGQRSLRAELPRILATPPPTACPRAIALGQSIQFASDSKATTHLMPTAILTRRH